MPEVNITADGYAFFHLPDLDKRLSLEPAPGGNGAECACCIGYVVGPHWHLLLTAPWFQSSTATVQIFRPDGTASQPLEARATPDGVTINLTSARATPVHIAH